MSIIWSDQAWEDYEFWHKTDKKMVKKINKLIEAIEQTPYIGIGKPEPLRFNWSGYWSRRISREHRLVYKVEKNVIYVAQCRFHY